ncbi:MAG TPA: hypothetical protein VGH64_11780, partial [Puia sp.]
MKKVSIGFTVVAIYMITIMQGVYAQGINKKTATSDFQIPPVAVDGVNHADDLSIRDIDRDLNTKAILNFNKTYKKIKEPQWSGTLEGGVVARFEFNKITNRIFYDRKGKWLGTISGYNEDKLPAGIIKLVNSNYHDF